MDSMVSDAESDLQSDQQDSSLVPARKRKAKLVLEDVSVGEPSDDEIDEDAKADAEDDGGSDSRDDAEGAEVLPGPEDDAQQRAEVSEADMPDSTSRYHNRLVDTEAADVGRKPDTDKKDFPGAPKPSIATERSKGSATMTPAAGLHGARVPFAAASSKAVGQLAGIPCAAPFLTTSHATCIPSTPHRVAEPPAPTTPGVAAAFASPAPAAPAAAFGFPDAVPVPSTPAFAFPGAVPATPFAAPAAGEERPAPMTPEGLRGAWVPFTAASSNGVAASSNAFGHPSGLHFDDGVLSSQLVLSTRAEAILHSTAAYTAADAASQQCCLATIHSIRAGNAVYRAWRYLQELEQQRAAKGVGKGRD